MIINDSIDNKINLRGQEIRTFLFEFEDNQVVADAFTEISVTTQRKIKRLRQRKL